MLLADLKYFDQYRKRGNLLHTNDIIFLMYIFFSIIVLFISYKYASYMIKKTGLFLSYSFIGSMINLVLLMAGILTLSIYFWGINEFLFLKVYILV